MQPRQLKSKLLTRWLCGNMLYFGFLNRLRLLVAGLPILGEGIAVIDFVIECDERIFAFTIKSQFKRNSVAGALDAGVPYAHFLQNFIVFIQKIVGVFEIKLCHTR